MSTSEHLDDRERLRPEWFRRPAPHIVLLGVGGSAAVGLSWTLLGPIAAAVLVGVATVVLSAFRPAAAAYLYFAALPFLAGIDRGQLLPLVRPNEAVLALLVAGAVLGGYLRFLRGDPVTIRFGPLDLPLAGFVLASTLWPVLSVMLRGRIPDGEELAALMPILKLTGLLILVRSTITTPRRQQLLLRIVVWSAALVAVIAILQTAGFPPVLRLLGSVWTPSESPDDIAERGTTTLASSIATGDYIVLALALLIGMAARATLVRRETLVLLPVLGAGVLAAGQFSTWAAMLTVGIVLLRQYPELVALGRRFLPALLVIAVAGAPAAITRLSEFGGEFGMPRSWLGRWDNLTSFYLPPFDVLHVLLGISPNTVLQAPETWRDAIYLEFGYLQLLWVGGIPLLVAFGWLSWSVLRRAARLRDDPEPRGVAATALYAAWWMVLVLSVIDIHLTLRGAGDLLFLLLAIVGGPTNDDPSPYDVRTPPAAAARDPAP